MKNIGGTFPVGEIFSEPVDLGKVNGSLTCFGFPNIERRLEICKPFKVIKNGFCDFPTNIRIDTHSEWSFGKNPR